MALLGLHMSITGGFDQAVQRAANVHADVVQLFSKNNNQWKAKPITDESVEKFQAALEEKQISHPLIHDSYLINMASPDDDLWKRSINAFVEELQRAETLGVSYVVAHPGAYTSSSEEQGLKRIVQALDEVHRQLPKIKSKCLLETVAGQGTTLGWKFEQLATILSSVKHPERLGVCLDTCHVFAAGYPLSTKKEYEQTMKSFDDIIGVEQIKAFHLNDSKKELGSKVDRHAGIGEGFLGKSAFKHLLNDERFINIPMYLETPKGEEGGEDLDLRNLKILRKLIQKRA